MEMGYIRVELIHRTVHNICYTLHYFSLHNTLLTYGLMVLNMTYDNTYFLQIKKKVTTEKIKHLNSHHSYYIKCI